MENVFALISPHIDIKMVKKYLVDKGLDDIEIWSEGAIPPFINPLETMIILLLSGGTELLVKKIVEKAFSTVYINSVPINNSLSATAELTGYYSNNSEIEIASFSEDTFKLLFNIDKIKRLINRSKLMLIGRPHEWILTSENISPPAPFQSKLLPVNMRELRVEISKVNQEKAISEAEYWDNKVDLCNISKEVYFTSAMLYLSFKQLLSRVGANMLGVRCGDLQEYGASVCLALDRLSEENIITSCEGDIETAFSMKVIKLLSDKPCWMANISDIDFSAGKIFLTHCTMPINMFSLDRKTHEFVSNEYNFEDEFLNVKKQMPVTLFRLGKDQKYSVLEGKTKGDFMGKHCNCRDTLEIETDASLSEWFDNICGNHQVLVYGNYAEQIRYFFSIL